MILLPVLGKKHLNYTLSVLTQLQNPLGPHIIKLKIECESVQ